MDLSRHYEAFQKALLKAFKESDLAMNITFDFKFDYKQEVSGDNSRERVFDLLKIFDRQDRIDELFVKSLSRNPGNREMRALAQTLAVEVQQRHGELADQAIEYSNKDFENAQADRLRAGLQSYVTTGALEAMVVKAHHLQTGQEVEGWERGMRDSQVRVCLIRKGDEPSGTGFLVGPDRIITNSHVVAEGAAAGDYNALFDYRGKDAAIGGFPRYKLVEELARSQPKEFDYAIYRLEKVPAGKRGYFKARAYQFNSIREPVSVLGHPQGKPQAFAFGVVFDNNSFFGRVAYTANTSPGSSGSPVFTENWDLVAVHHHGETNVNNHGIPMAAILKDLKDHGNGGLLESA